MLKKSWNDAKKVVSKGNMFMLAIGMLIGAAFGAVVKSLANDVIMQAIAKAVGIKGVESMSYGSTKWKDGVPLDGIMYGKFLSALLAFIIVAFFVLLGLMIVYLIINYRKRKAIAPAPAGPSIDEQILEELKKLNSTKITKPKITNKTPTKKPTTKKVVEKAPVKKKVVAKKTTTKKTTTKKTTAKKTATKKRTTKK